MDTKADDHKCFICGACERLLAGPQLLCYTLCIECRLDLAIHVHDLKEIHGMAGRMSLRGLRESINGYIDDLKTQTKGGLNQDVQVQDNACCTDTGARNH